MLKKEKQLIYMFNDDKPNQDLRPIIPVLIGLSEGRGDWIHGLEIAKSLKEKFGNRYRIFGFPSHSGEGFANNVILEIDKFFNSLKQGSPTQQDKYSEYKLKVNPYFDYLFPVSDDYISPTFAKFIEDKNEIFCMLKISCLNTCCWLKKDQVESYDLNFPIIYLPEYAFSFLHHRLEDEISYNLKDFNCEDNLQNVLFMGFDKYSKGIRIYNSSEEENYWKQLRKQNRSLFDKLLMHNNYDYTQYHENRKLLPGDLRTVDSIFKFIEINLIRYGSKCDFYLPKKLIESILSETVNLKKLEEILINYNIEKCNYITSNSDLPNNLDLNSNTYFSAGDNIFREKEIRIFSGFDLSDNLYKGLYLYNREAGAGISGDDGWSLAISGGNLPFINNGNWQSYVIESIIDVTEKLHLDVLNEYFDHLNCSDQACDDFKIKKFSQLKELCTNQKELLKTEYAKLVAHVKKEMNIYDKLEEKILAIEEQQKQDKKVNNMIKKS